MQTPSDLSTTAHVASSAAIGAGVSIGHFSVVEDGVVLGDGCVVGHHVVIRLGSRVGPGSRIDDHAVIGKQPMRAAASATTGAKRYAGAVLGARCLVGASVVIYAGCHIGDDVLVADLATVREDVQIGTRTIIGRGVAIENRCRIGARCKFETNAYLCAFSDVADDCFIAPGVLTSNDNYLGRDSARFDHFRGITVEQGGRLGVGAVVLPGRRVHREGVGAAGALVTRDVPSRTTVAGVPARFFGDVPTTQYLDSSEK